MDEEIGVVLIVLLVVLVVFLICREIVCWYWKINKQISLLESIDSHLQTLCNRLNPGG